MNQLAPGISDQEESYQSELEVGSWMVEHANTLALTSSPLPNSVEEKVLDRVVAGLLCPPLLLTRSSLRAGQYGRWEPGQGSPEGAAMQQSSAYSRQFSNHIRPLMKRRQSKAALGASGAIG